jgi:hypothetical protein
MEAASKFSNALRLRSAPKHKQPKLLANVSLQKPTDPGSTCPSATKRVKSSGNVASGSSMHGESIAMESAKPTASKSHSTQVSSDATYLELVETFVETVHFKPVLVTKPNADLSSDATYLELVESANLSSSAIYMDSFDRPDDSEALEAAYHEPTQRYSAGANNASDSTHVDVTANGLLQYTKHVIDDKRVDREDETVCVATSQVRYYICNNY